MVERYLDCGNPRCGFARIRCFEREGKIHYRYGKDRREAERMDYLEFIARVTSHIPDKGQVTVCRRLSGPYPPASTQFDKRRLLD